MPSLETPASEAGDVFPIESSVPTMPLLTGLETFDDGGMMSDALRESNARFSVLCDAMPQMV